MSSKGTKTTSETTEIRVRFAPSPTGYLHVGGARSALFNYLFAKKHNGKFILRIEDTDQARSTDESLKMMIQDLTWLGLNWDEGPHPETFQDIGPYGPYKQSQRLAIYHKVAQELLEKGKAFYCFMSEEEIETAKKKLTDKLAEKLTAPGEGQAHVESPYENLPLAEARERLKRGDKAVVRFKTHYIIDQIKQTKKEYILNDLIRGEIKFPSDMVGDFVLLRSDGMPVYNFCCAIDDYMMKISHVLRAEEHLPNTLRQLMIYEAMDWALPQFGHISLVLDEDRQKLSKRKGAVACDQFRIEGYLPEALLNYLALLGWTHPEQKEILSLQEMSTAFSLDRVHPSGAVFDRVKLKWLNAQHLRALPNVEIYQKIEPFLKQAGIHLPNDLVTGSVEADKQRLRWQIQSVEVFKPYLEVLSDAVSLYSPLDDNRYEIVAESDEVLKLESTKTVLTIWQAAIADHPGDFLSEMEFVTIQDEVKNKSGQKGKNLFFPIRIALIGKPHGAELKTLVPLMSKFSILARAKKALARC